jgi:hypothetical protein
MGPGAVRHYLIKKHSEKRPEAAGEKQNAEIGIARKSEVHNFFKLFATSGARSVHANLVGMN